MYSTAAQEGYVDAGSGPDIVAVIHGGPGFTIDYFLEDLRPLADGHVLLFYDQRGTGGSTLVSDSASLIAERFVDDLDALRKHLEFGVLTCSVIPGAPLWLHATQ